MAHYSFISKAISLIPKGYTLVTTCLQYSIWLKFNKLCYWQINYLFQCCCQCQKECFKQRNRTDTLKRLSLIIYNSQNRRIYIVFPWWWHSSIKSQRSQPKSSHFLFIKRRETKKLNWGCQVVLWKKNKDFNKLAITLLLICCVTLGKSLNCPGLVSLFSNWS